MYVWRDEGWGAVTSYILFYLQNYPWYVYLLPNLKVSKLSSDWWVRSSRSHWWGSPGFNSSFLFQFHDGLYVCVSQSSQVEILLPRVMVLGGEAFERWLGHEGGYLMSEINALIQQIPERYFAPPQLKIWRKVCHSEEDLHPTMTSWAQMPASRTVTCISYL